jgi:hypothetical protein
MTVIRLKRCYFETCRFSEDPDFTLTEAEHQDEPFLVGAFKEIAGWIYDAWRGKVVKKAPSAGGRLLNRLISA